MADEESFKATLNEREKEVYEAGWNDAVKSIRCALRLPRWRSAG